MQTAVATPLHSECKRHRHAGPRCRARVVAWRTFGASQHFRKLSARGRRAEACRKRANKTGDGLALGWARRDPKKSTVAHAPKSLAHAPKLRAHAPRCASYGYRVARRFLTFAFRWWCAVVVARARCVRARMPGHDVDVNSPAACAARLLVHGPHAGLDRSLSGHTLGAVHNALTRRSSPVVSCRALCRSRQSRR